MGASSGLCDATSAPAELPRSDEFVSVVGFSYCVKNTDTAGSRLAFRVADDGSLNVQVLAKGSDALFGLLARAYSRDRADIVKALRTLASHATVVLESAAAVRV